MKLGRLAAVLVLGLLWAGCYNPHIKPGALICAENQVCPDNFHCGLDNRCYPPDAGPAPAVCNSVTPDASTCSRPPASDQPCNLACASGCSCGWCGVSGGAVMCLTGTPGTKQIGQVCDPSNAADCAPGLFCFPECGTGRCYKHCDPSNGNADCPGTACSLPASMGSLSFELCQLKDPMCDPVSGGPCPSGFACYAFLKSTECDCAGTHTTGGSCSSVEDCAPGYACISVGGAGTCQKTCKTSADCPLGICSNPANTTYGYCSL